MTTPIMNVRDTVSGSQGECFVTIGERRYNFMSLKKINAKMEKNKEKVTILGKTGESNKTTGWKGSGTMSVYYNTSVLRKLMEVYKNTGEDFYFDTQITNADLASSAGRQTVILKDCNLDSIVLAMLDTESSNLEEDLDFTFDDFDIPESFTALVGM